MHMALPKVMSGLAAYSLSWLSSCLRNCQNGMLWLMYLLALLLWTKSFLFSGSVNTIWPSWEFILKNDKHYVGLSSVDASSLTKARKCKCVLWSVPYIGHSLWSPQESTTITRVIEQIRDNYYLQSQRSLWHSSIQDWHLYLQSPKIHCVFYRSTFGLTHSIICTS